MPHRAAVRDLLATIDLFAGLDETSLDAIAGIARERLVHTGEFVKRQGENSGSFFAIHTGTFDVFLWDDLFGIERPLNVLRAGEVFGEMALLTDEPSHANVRAREDAKVWEFPHDAFLTRCAELPSIGLKLARTLAQRLATADRARGIPHDRLAAHSPTSADINLLPLPMILRLRVLPLSQDAESVTVAIVDPADAVARNTVAQVIAPRQAMWVAISAPDFEQFVNAKLYEFADVPTTADGESASPRELRYIGRDGLPAESADSATAQQFDDILRTAIDTGASDVHFEPGAKAVAVRARIDGFLVEITPPMAFADYKRLVSRVKVLSGLDITERRLPQDSSMGLLFESRHIDVRISTLPTPMGESVVCRLLDPVRRQLDLPALVAAPHVADVVERLFFLPAGLVLVTGPTGSGKTTTLYAGLHTLLKKSPTLKLVTAEDPVEYQFEACAQVQVNAAIGLTFPRILRSVLRQDPDVVLVGEMRDPESMMIGLEAALTGHLMLSSLHTADAFETIHRLKQQGAPPYLIAATLKGIVGQQLLPRLCPHCATPLDSASASAPQSAALARLIFAGVVADGEAVNFRHSPGCRECRMQGHLGRIASFEVLAMSDGLREAIEANGSRGQMQTATPAETFLPMRRYTRFLLDEGLVAAASAAEIFPFAAHDVHL